MSRGETLMSVSVLIRVDFVIYRSCRRWYTVRNKCSQRPLSRNMCTLVWKTSLEISLVSSWRCSGVKLRWCKVKTSKVIPINLQNWVNYRIVGVVCINKILFVNLFWQLTKSYPIELALQWLEKLIHYPSKYKFISKLHKIAHNYYLPNKFWPVPKGRIDRLDVQNGVSNENLSVCKNISNPN